MNPSFLLGMPYRLGADPIKHGAADCLTLSKTVIEHYGYNFPSIDRNWYRRLRRKDYAVFFDELNKWGVKRTTPNMGAIAIAESDIGLGLAAYYCEGWLCFQKTLGESVVIWNPIGALKVHGVYYLLKRNYVML